MFSVYVYRIYNIIRKRKCFSTFHNGLPIKSNINYFEIEDKSFTWEVGGYYTKKPNEIELTLLSFAYGAKPFTFSDVPDQDWVSHVQRNLPPVEAGRFFVFGNHGSRVPRGVALSQLRHLWRLVQVTMEQQRVAYWH